jgi:hypothetical protein
MITRGRPRRMDTFLRPSPAFMPLRHAHGRESDARKTTHSKKQDHLADGGRVKPTSSPPIPRWRKFGCEARVMPVDGGKGRTLVWATCQVANFPAMSTGTPVRSGPVQSGRCRTKAAHAQSPRVAQMRCTWLPERQRLEFRAFISPSRRTIRPRARQRIRLSGYSTTGWAVFHILAIRDPASRGALRTGISTQASPQNQPDRRRCHGETYNATTMTEPKYP